MRKTKPCFWLIPVLAVAFCVPVQSSDKNAPVEDKIEWVGSLRLLQKKTNTPMPPYLLPSKKTHKSTKAVNGTGAISGHVTQAAGGADIEGVQVWADQLTCPSYNASAYTNASGFYIIEGLPSGNYEVYTENDSVFVDLYWNNKLPWENADTVYVTSGNTTGNIDFSLRVGGEITGTVTLTGVYTPVMVTISATNIASGDVYSGSAWGVGGSAPYVIKKLPTGTYKVKTFNYTGYIDVYYDDKPNQASADLVPVTEGATASSTDFTLNWGTAIEGNITSASKEPLEGIFVYGYYASDPEWYSFGLTHEYGDYRMIGIRSGNWKIIAYGDTTYAFEWYDNKNTWNDADNILVTTPDTVSGKNFTLEVGGSISGHVYNTEKGPLSGCDVFAYDSSTYLHCLWLPAKGDTTIADGSYQITGLRTGDYYVVAMTECDMMWHNDKPTPEQADLVHVTMPDETSGIDFNLSSAVEDESDITTSRPTEFELSQNYPNPFNPGTEIEYTLKKPAQVNLQIYNLLGRQVRTLVSKYQSAGSHHVVWDGKNSKGKEVSSGVYFYSLKVNGVSQAKRMVLLK